jgi:hypothetical protein
LQIYGGDGRAEAAGYGTPVVNPGNIEAGRCDEKERDGPDDGHPFGVK